MALTSGCDSSDGPNPDANWIDEAEISTIDLPTVSGSSEVLALARAEDSVPTPGTAFVALGGSTNSLTGILYDISGTSFTFGVDLATELQPFDPNAPLYDGAGTIHIDIAGISPEGHTRISSHVVRDVRMSWRLDFSEAPGPLQGAIQATGGTYAWYLDPPIPDDFPDLLLARGPQLVYVSGNPSADPKFSACLPRGATATVGSIAHPRAFTDEAGRVAAVVLADATEPEIVIFDGWIIKDAFARNGGQLGPCFGGGEAVTRIAGPGGEPDFGAAIRFENVDFAGKHDLVVVSPEANRAHIYLDPEVAARHLVLEAEPEASGFGASVATSGGQIVVGAPFTDSGDVHDSGAAYVYRWDHSADALQLVLTVRDSAPRPDRRLGQSVLLLPNFNEPSGYGVLVVAGAREILTFFRTPLYDDVRSP